MLGPSLEELLAPIQRRIGRKLNSVCEALQGASTARWPSRLYRRARRRLQGLYTEMALHQGEHLTTPYLVFAIQCIEEEIGRAQQQTMSEEARRAWSHHVQIGLQKVAASCPDCFYETELMEVTGHLETARAQYDPDSNVRVAGALFRMAGLEYPRTVGGGSVVYDAQRFLRSGGEHHGRTH